MTKLIEGVVGPRPRGWWDWLLGVAAGVLIAGGIGLALFTVLETLRRAVTR